MDAKTTLIVAVVFVVTSIDTSHAAMPFGRLTPLHYSPDDIRTVVVPRTERSVSFSSLPLNGLSASRLFAAPAPRKLGIVTLGNPDTF
jgi:hypothetical protein